MSHHDRTICPHDLPLEDCPWCAPARVVQQAPPHILADLGAEEVSEEPRAGRILPNGPADTDQEHGHV
jgi:hypothetical protein